MCCQLVIIKHQKITYNEKRQQKSYTEIQIVEGSLNGTRNKVSL